MDAPRVPRVCPACRAVVVPGRASCVSCGMPVAKMADFQLARRAAGQAAGQRQSGRRAVGWVAALIISGAILAGYAAFHEGDKAAWQAYPSDRTALVQQFFEYIHADTDSAFDKAYGLVSLRVKHPAERDERGRYRQTFHDLARYLRGEFGDDWIAALRLQRADGNDSTEIATLVTVQTEQLSVPLDLQGPAGATPEQLASQPDAYRHYGVRGVSGFPVELAGQSQQREGIAGVLRVYGAAGSAEQLAGIVGAAGSPLHEIPIETKRRLLPLVRNPRGTALPRALHQLWPVRRDPTVAARLESIMGDQRYDPLLRAIAQRVHDGTEDPEALLADGVNVP